jgi:hypothetical protein
MKVLLRWRVIQPFWEVIPLSPDLSDQDPERSLLATANALSNAVATSESMCVLVRVCEQSIYMCVCGGGGGKLGAQCPQPLL